MSVEFPPILTPPKGWMTLEPSNGNSYVDSNRKLAVQFLRMSNEEVQFFRYKQGWVYMSRSDYLEVKALIEFL